MRTKPFEELPNPPPPGSTWARIEDERRRLGWSARQLSSNAGLSSSHYSLMSLRNTWNADLATIDKFIGALVAAGAPENDLRFGLPVSARDRQAVVLPADPMRQRAAELLVQRGYGIAASVLAVGDIHGGPELNAELVAGLAEDAIKSKIRHGLLPADVMGASVDLASQRPEKPSQKTG